MADPSTIRQYFLSPLLSRVDGSTRPWTNGQLDTFIQEVIAELWPTVGLFVEGDVASDPYTMEYAVPSNILRVSRIDLVDATTGLYIDVVRNWRPVPVPGEFPGGWG